MMSEPHPDDVKEAEAIVLEQTFVGARDGQVYVHERESLINAIALALAARREKEGQDDEALRAGIRQDIDNICCIYRTVGDAMWDEPRQRLADRITTRVAALSAQGKEQGAKDGK